MTVVGVIACSSPPQTTRMTADDLEVISRELASGVAVSQAVIERTPDSPLWIVSIDKVQNLSSDVMTESEQWSVVQRLRGTLPVQALWKQKNIRFVIPPERRQALETIDEFERYGAQRKPTHQMTVTFRSLTRADEANRTELYYCEFELFELTSSQLIWSDKFEYKRAAAGHLWD